MTILLMLSYHTVLYGNNFHHVQLATKNFFHPDDDGLDYLLYRLLPCNMPVFKRNKFYEYVKLQYISLHTWIWSDLFSGPALVSLKVLQSSTSTPFSYMLPKLLLLSPCWSHTFAGFLLAQTEMTQLL